MTSSDDRYSDDRYSDDRYVDDNDSIEPAGNFNVFRNGKVHVLEDKCQTCVFRPGNLMSLAPGRLKDLVQSNLEQDTALVCHSTLDESCQAVCRGFYDRYDPTPLKFAKALNVVAFDKVPSKDGENPGQRLAGG